MKKLLKAAIDTEAFRKSEAQFNLLVSLADSRNDMVIVSQDQNIIAIYNTGRPLWLYINREMGARYVDNKISILARKLKDEKLYGITAAPDVAKAFANEYVAQLSIGYELSLTMESYEAEVVIAPRGVGGSMVEADQTHLQKTCEYLAGFIKEMSGYDVTTESQIPAAKRLIESGDLYFWQDNNKISSMVYIAHRSKRHARLHYIYCDPAQRKKGYASALIAEVSRKLLREGLSPLAYADLKDPGLSRLFERIGFETGGRISEYIFKY